MIIEHGGFLSEEAYLAGEYSVNRELANVTALKRTTVYRVAAVTTVLLASAFKLDSCQDGGNLNGALHSAESTANAPTSTFVATQVPSLTPETPVPPINSTAISGGGNTIFPWNTDSTPTP